MTGCGRLCYPEHDVDDQIRCGTLYEHSDNSSGLAVYICDSCRLKVTSDLLERANDDLKVNERVLDATQAHLKSLVSKHVTANLAIRGAITALEAGDTVSALALLKATTQ